MTFQELQEKIRMNEQNIAITYEKMRTIREKRIVHTDYIDENKSVKWNREEIARRNQHVEDELKRFKQQINEFEKNINQDILFYIQENYGLNEKTASLVFQQAYEDGHPSGPYEVISYAQTYAQFATDVIQANQPAK